MHGALHDSINMNFLLLIQFIALLAGGKSSSPFFFSLNEQNNGIYKTILTRSNSKATTNQLEYIAETHLFCYYYHHTAVQ